MGFRASDAELGDLREAYALGDRSALWLCRQVASTLRRHRPGAVHEKGRRPMLSNLSSDVRYGWRTLRRNPGFAVAAIAPIALGIGIDTGIFSILNSVALRPLPTPDSGAMVSIHQELRGVQHRRVEGSRSMFSLPEYRVYRDRTQTLSGLMAFSRPWAVALGGESPQEIEGAVVSCNYFEVLRLRPLFGPGFTASNCEHADAPAVILSHDLWTRVFASDPEIVHKPITMNGQSVAVAGIAPPGFGGIDIVKVAFFAPAPVRLALRSADKFIEDPDMSWLSLAGRRRDGAGITEVRAELLVIAGSIDQQHPGRTTAVNIAPATTLSLPEARRDIWKLAPVVLIAFGLVLLIACANVANLLLARAANRTKEIAVRLSVGATRARLVQQLLTESLMIAVSGGIAGSLLAWWTFRSLLAFVLTALPGRIPALSVDANPNVTVLWYGLGLTIVTALVFGLAPALQASRQDVQTVLKQDGAGSGRRSRGWLRGALIVVQVAVCLVLLVSAALLLRALYAAQTTDPGFGYRGVAVASFNLGGPSYDGPRRIAFERGMAERLAALPGVDGVERASKIPLSPGHMQTQFRVPRREEWHDIDMNMVSPGYFSLIGIPIVRGRTFLSSEIGTRSRAVIVTEATARRFWPGVDPVGQTLIMGLGPQQEVALSIVGVTADAQVGTVGQTETSYMYLPAEPDPERRLNLLVRGGEFGAVAAGIRDAARQLDPALAVRVNPLEENLTFWRTLSRLMSGLSGSLGLLALALASLGVYGVVSCIVSRRIREVGIRMMLGASGRHVQALILRQTLLPVGIGTLLGIAGALAASRILESVLFGVSPFDPIAFLGAPLFLLGVAACAALLPARRAVNLDPMTTLRYD